MAPFVASHAPNRYNHAATLGALMLISHISKIVAFGFIGFAIGSFVPLMAAMVLAGAAGNWLGEIALDYTSEDRFRLILQLVLTALGLRLIWMAVPELGGFDGSRVPGEVERSGTRPGTQRKLAKRIFFWVPALAPLGRDTRPEITTPADCSARSRGLP